MSSSSSSSSSDGDSANFTQNMQHYKDLNPKLTTADVQKFNKSRLSYYKGTIAVCIIYAVFCITLLLIALFSPAGSQLITNKFNKFTITFVCGMVITIIILVTVILMQKPTHKAIQSYDFNSCPDYWSLQQTTNTNPNYANADMANQDLMQYVCMNTQNLGNVSNPPDIGKITNPSIDMEHLYSHYNKNAHFDTNKTSISTLDCSQVFPGLLNTMNAKDSSVNNIPNAYACDYANQCGIAWTGMCPSGQNNIVY